MPNFTYFPHNLDGKKLTHRWQGRGSSLEDIGKFCWCHQIETQNRELEQKLGNLLDFSHIMI